MSNVYSTYRESISTIFPYDLVERQALRYENDTLKASDAFPLTKCAIVRTVNPLNAIYSNVIKKVKAREHEWCYKNRILNSYQWFNSHFCDRTRASRSRYDFWLRSSYSAPVYPIEYFYDIVKANLHSLLLNSVHTYSSKVNAFKYIFLCYAKSVR